VDAYHIIKIGGCLWLDGEGRQSMDAFLCFLVMSERVRQLQDLRETTRLSSRKGDKGRMAVGYEIGGEERGELHTKAQYVRNAARM
jgi:hypothetical protein